MSAEGDRHPFKELTVWQAMLRGFLAGFIPTLLMVGMVIGKDAWEHGRWAGGWMLKNEIERAARTQFFDDVREAARAALERRKAKEALVDQ